MAFTMACPNCKKGLKMVFGPLGVNGDKRCVVKPWKITWNGRTLPLTDEEAAIVR
jgi:hypothetical protein